MATSITSMSLFNISNTLILNYYKIHHAWVLNIFQHPGILFHPEWHLPTYYKLQLRALCEGSHPRDLAPALQELLISPMKTSLLDSCHCPRAESTFLVLFVTVVRANTDSEAHRTCPCFKFSWLRGPKPGILRSLVGSIRENRRITAKNRQKLDRKQVRWQQNLSLVQGIITVRWNRHICRLSTVLTRPGNSHFRALLKT